MLIELKRRYFRTNNGGIHLSQRAAANALNIAPNTAKKGLDELLAKGFIKISQRGSFSQKTRNATTWVLTEYEYKNQLATKDFTRLTIDDLDRMKTKK